MSPARTLIVDHGRSRRRWAPARGRVPAVVKRGGAAPSRQLKEIENFGANPGALRMLAYAPKNLPAGSPLVVVLHGCAQNAEIYDQHAGWTALADELGFAVIYPEQRKSNNPGGCFNWFLPADSSRGLGETRSIHEMVEHFIARRRLDRDRVYVTGLSAGGAMTAALLADYPETFTAGAIIAGLPCGAATSVQEVFKAMAEPQEKTAEELGDLVRAGSRHEGPWPRVAILHGTADKTVSPKNADELVRQWVNVHGGSEQDFREDLVDGHRRRVWSVGDRDVVESITLKGFGHAAPLSARLGENEGPFMLDAGMSSTRRIAEFFALDAKAHGRRPAQAATAPRATAPARQAETTGTAIAARDDGARAPTAERPARSVSSTVSDILSRATRAFGWTKRAG